MGRKSRYQKLFELISENLYDGFQMDLDKNLIPVLFKSYMFNRGYKVRETHLDFGVGLIEIFIDNFIIRIDAYSLCGIESAVLRVEEVGE